MRRFAKEIGEFSGELRTATFWGAQAAFVK
jgi:hypothetical protein